MTGRQMRLRLARASVIVLAGVVWMVVVPTSLLAAVFALSFGDLEPGGVDIDYASAGFFLAISVAISCLLIAVVWWTWRQTKLE